MERKDVEEPSSDNDEKYSKSYKAENKGINSEDDENELEEKPRGKATVGWGETSTSSNSSYFSKKIQRVNLPEKIVQRPLNLNLVKHLKINISKMMEKSQKFKKFQI